MSRNSRMWMRRVGLSLAAPAALVAAAATAQSVVSKADFETIPPAVTESESALKGAPVSLSKAMSSAEEAAGGAAVSARAVIGSGGAVTYEFMCTAGGVMKRVEVDGQSGKVTAATITLNAAIAKALERAPGVVRVADSNLLADPPLYVVQVLAAGKVHELSIDATSGEIVEEVIKGRFPGVLAEGEMVSLPSGLKYIEVVEGTGATPAGPSSNVKVHYTGYLVDGTKFDSSVDRGQPTSFALNRVVKGWSEGVSTMKVGGKRKLIIPYALAYGAEGRGPIPPKATLIFDIELLGTE